mmetsp:Transcript_61271/g.171328  ORF Transcript_61271/g.171328 Transcript_61271/m.171328 type:complete len:223 (+) Transcript_61271:797-1465(+)
MWTPSNPPLGATALLLHDGSGASSVGGGAAASEVLASRSMAATAVLVPPKIFSNSASKSSRSAPNSGDSWVVPAASTSVGTVSLAGPPSGGSSDGRSDVLERCVSRRSMSNAASCAKKAWSKHLRANGRRRGFNASTSVRNAGACGEVRGNTRATPTPFRSGARKRTACASRAKSGQSANGWPSTVKILYNWSMVDVPQKSADPRRSSPQIRPDAQMSTGDE